MAERRNAAELAAAEALYRDLHLPTRRKNATLWMAAAIVDDRPGSSEQGLVTLPSTWQSSKRVAVADLQVMQRTPLYTPLGSRSSVELTADLGAIGKGAPPFPQPGSPSSTWLDSGPRSNVEKAALVAADPSFHQSQTWQQGHHAAARSSGDDLAELARSKTPHTSLYLGALCAPHQMADLTT